MIGLFIQATSMEGTRNVLLVLTGQQEKVLNLQGNESLIATVINGMDLALPETPPVPDNGMGEPRQVCIPHTLSELTPTDKFKLVMSNPPLYADGEDVDLLDVDWSWVLPHPIRASRFVRILQKLGIHTVADMSIPSRADYMHTPGIGRISLMAIEGVLHMYGYTLSAGD